jgi:hypothetical protein
MKYAVEIGSGAMIDIPSVMKIVSHIQKLIGGDTHTDTQTNKHGQQGDLILFFQKKKGSRLKEKYVMKKRIKLIIHIMLVVKINLYLSSIFIPVSPTWSIGHP